MEVWKDIYFIQDGVEWDYRGLYQVSSEGRVKSLNYKRTGKERILKPGRIINSGYLFVNLCKNNKGKIFYVHRLVAHMFCEGYFNGAVVDHINTIKTDNRVVNLRWCTSKENNNNPLTKQKTSETQKGKFVGKNNPRAKRVAQYDKHGNLIRIWDYAKQVSEELGISDSNIIQCCKGKLKSCGGFIWKYVEED